MRTGRLKTTNEEVFVIETEKDFIEFNIEFHNRFHNMINKNHVITEENNIILTKALKGTWKEIESEEVLVIPTKVFQNNKVEVPTIINTNKENIILTG